MAPLENDVKSTRDRVLQTLLTHDQCTINELADSVDINPISVRHHITKLEAEGYVASTEERHGVGRPRRIYYLTKRGREQFPKRYLTLTLRLLDQLKETLPENMVNELFSQMAFELAADYKDEIDGMNIEDRLDLIQTVLSDEGFTVNWEKSGNTYQIHESSCPYIHVGHDHPEICSVDQTLISSLLDVPAEKIKCKLNGDSHCTYVIPDLEIMENQSL